MSSSTIRFTPEFIKACETLWRDGFDKGVNGEDEHPDFKSFFIDTCPKVREEPSFEEMEKLPFNPTKCEARVEKHGFAIQCTRSPFGTGCLCKTHQNMFDKLPDGKDIPYGRFNKPRPDVTLDKGNPISWGPKKTRNKSTNNQKPSQSKLKVGEMRDYLSSRIPSEDFRNLKKKELTKLYLDVKEKENTSSDEENTPKSTTTEKVEEQSTEQPEEQSTEQPEEQSTEQPVENTPEEQSTEQPVENTPEEQSEKQSTEQPEENHIGEQPEENHIGEQPEEQPEEKHQDDATGTGLSLEPVKPIQLTTVSEYKALFKELSIDSSGMRGIRAYKQAYDNYLKEKEEAEKTLDMSDVEDDDLQEDKHSYDETDFEGVSYLEDEDSGKIYNMRHQYVGKWNSDFDGINWVSDEFKDAHESARP